MSGCLSCAVNKCEMCKPKLIDCPKCGKRGRLTHERCLECGYVFTDEDAEAVRASWQKRKDDSLSKMGIEPKKLPKTPPPAPRRRAVRKENLRETSAQR